MVKDAKQGGAPRTIEEVVDAVLKEKPWMDQAKVDQVRESCEKFTKQFATPLQILANLEGRENPQSVLEVFGDDIELAMAVLTQNLQHPKNSHRADAIKEGKYVIIDSSETASKYLHDLAKYHLTNAIRAARSEVMNQMNSMQQSQDLKLLVTAPDVFITAVALSDKDFFEGRGDRTTFFNIILGLNPA
jgi:hypothetical protein